MKYLKYFESSSALSRDLTLKNIFDIATDNGLLVRAVFLRKGKHHETDQFMIPVSSINYGLIEETEEVLLDSCSQIMERLTNEGYKFNLCIYNEGTKTPVGQITKNNKLIEVKDQQNLDKAYNCVMINFDIILPEY